MFACPVFLFAYWCSFGCLVSLSSSSLQAVVPVEKVGAGQWTTTAPTQREERSTRTWFLLQPKCHHPRKGSKKWVVKIHWKSTARDPPRNETEARLKSRLRHGRRRNPSAMPPNPVFSS